MGILLVSHADKHLSTTYAETDRRLKQTSSNKHNTMTQQTLLSIRQQLAQRGTHGFRSFVVALDKVDFNKIRSIDKEQWKSALASVGVKLSGPEIESVFSAYKIKGGLSSRQEIIIDRVFEQLDVNGTGEIEMSDIRRKFNASLHPDASRGGKNTNQVNEEFYYVWEYVRGLHDGPVTLEQWRAVYSDIACSVSSEDGFVEALCSVWGVVELG